MYHSDTGGRVSFWKVKHNRSGVPEGISNDATTSMENDTVELVADNSLTTWLDESLISASKRALPSELVTTTGKVRGVVGKSMRELRQRPEGPSDFNFEKSTSDSGYEGIEVAVFRE